MFVQLFSSLQRFPSSSLAHNDTSACFCINPYSLQQSAKAQIEFDEYRSKVASLKDIVEEHGLDANSLFAQAGIETDSNGKD